MFDGPSIGGHLRQACEGEEPLNDDGEVGVFFRVRTGRGSASEQRRSAADASGDGSRHFAVDGSESAADGSWRTAAIESCDVGPGAAAFHDALASGSGIEDRATEAQARSHGMQRDVPERAIGILAGAEMSSGFIRDHADRRPMRLLFQVPEVSASGYRIRPKRPDSTRAVANRAATSFFSRMWPSRRAFAVGL